MAISPAVNFFCISIIILFLLIFIIKYLDSLLSDKTYLDAFFQSNIQKYEKSVDDFLISVVYSCDAPIRVIVEDLKTIENIYEQNFPLDQKLEMIIFADASHEDYGEIKLLNRCFPNLLLFTKSSPPRSASDFCMAAWIAKGKYIVNSKSFLKEVDNLQKKPKDYISVYQSPSLSYFSAISKSRIIYLSRIHFIHSIPIQEFQLISKSLKLSLNFVKTENTQKGKFFLMHIYHLVLLKAAVFCYDHMIWTTQPDLKKKSLNNSPKED